MRRERKVIVDKLNSLVRQERNAIDSGISRKKLAERFNPRWRRLTDQFAATYNMSPVEYEEIINGRDLQEGFIY